MENDQLKAARELLHHSHLSVADSEGAFAEFELALHHVWEAFGRWSSELNAYVSSESLPVQDVSVLQVIRMNERPKSAADIGKFLNRDDSANILYSLRKLEKAGLIEKTGGPLRQTTYQVSARGRQVTDRYAALRRDILLTNVAALSGSRQILEQLSKNMWLLSGLYEQAARSVAVMSCLSGESGAAGASQEIPRERRAGRTRRRTRSAAIA